MSDVIEVLKEFIENSSSYGFSKEANNAIDEALLALEQKENDRKQGALEVLNKVLNYIKTKNATNKKIGLKYTTEPMFVKGKIQQNLEIETIIEQIKRELEGGDC